MAVDLQGLFNGAGRDRTQSRGAEVIIFSAFVLLVSFVLACLLFVSVGIAFVEFQNVQETR